MICNDFQDKKLSLLGFGTMRLPVSEEGIIDEAQVAAMTDYALAHGINYFDTAYPYHNGESERVIGRVLRAHPRDSYYLATKYPGQRFSAEEQNPAKIFEEQLEKCGVDYFDFYLLHNVNEKTMKIYLDPSLGIIDYFMEQKKKGRIKHFGFSCHARTKGLREFLDACGDVMEFGQLQLNYLDWTLQDAKGKYELLTKRGIPVWVMEPVRGGKLAQLPEADEAALKALRPEDSIASWGFRFLQGLPNVKMILSGMSNMAQMQDNIKTFNEYNPLSAEDVDLLLQIAEGLKSSVPCTSCRYCCDDCPMRLDIPMLLGLYNKLRTPSAADALHRLNELDEIEMPDICVGCGKCSTHCPQNIDIPAVLKDLAKHLA